MGDVLALRRTRHALITFVDAAKTRKKRDPGRCYRRAGFRHVGFTKGGLWAFQLLPEAMPAAQAPISNQRGLFLGVTA